MFGQATLVVKTSKLPTSGSLNVEAITVLADSAGYDGIAGVTSFRITAHDWVSSHGRSLEYEFRYMQVCALCSLNYFPQL